MRKIVNKPEPAFSDLLNFAHLVDDGIIINKDGALMMALEGRGSDLESASTAELNAVSYMVNRLACLLNDGWMLHVDEIRFPSTHYPPKGDFPEPVSRLLDEERRQQYESEGMHFENRMTLTFVWKFPKPKVNTMRHWFVKGLAREEDSQNLLQFLAEFKEKVSRCENLLSMHGWFQRLNSADFLSYLNTCITGNLLPMQVPSEDCFLDIALGRRDVVGGYSPKVGDNHVVVLSLAHYLSSETRPALLSAMGTYPLIYRWSNRFVFLSEGTAEREIKQYRRHWSNKIKGIGGILKESFTGRPVTKFNQDAQLMVAETDQALLSNSNHTTCFGYYTSCVIFMHSNISVLDTATASLQRYLEQTGFGVIRETVNAMDAWMGSIPGHGSCNIRRMFCHAVNLAHCLPLHTTWSGPVYGHSTSLLPKNAPPVFYAATTGQTPFRFHMDVADVGHQMVLGPTGAGKSTYLGFLIAQFLRYKNARVFVFDKDYSHRPLTYALSGHYYDISPNQALTFCPLADLSTDGKRLRATEWIEQLIVLQGLELTPVRRLAVHEAITAMAKESTLHRNLTVLSARIQDVSLRDALRYYTLDGAMPLMDATVDSLATQGHLHTFEMNWLLSQPAAVHLPVLRYLFDHIESCLEADQGKSPTIIVLEEAWLYMSHPLFSSKLIDWLKTLRKKNGRVIFATQSLSDLYDPSTGNLTKTTASIVNACPTKVYLPNPVMEEETRKLYLKIGLTEKQCDILSRVAIPKKHYYVKTPDGQRLLELGFSHKKVLALSFIGLSMEKGAALVACKNAYGDEWLSYWLRQEGFSEWADYVVEQEKKNENI